MKNLYHILKIKDKISSEGLRMMYLKDVWGMGQGLIAECEGKSQSYVSLAIRITRESIPAQEFIKAIDIRWSEEEVKAVQFAPVDVYTDTQVAAFIMDILGLEVTHPFFTHYSYHVNNRMCALAMLGVQNRVLQKLYTKNQSTVSMMIKRGIDKTKDFERSARYDKTAKYTFKRRAIATIEEPVRNKFIPAGGSTFIW